MMGRLQSFQLTPTTLRLLADVWLNGSNLIQVGSQLTPTTLVLRSQLTPTTR
jgi:hypothetical protein